MVGDLSKNRFADKLKAAYAQKRKRGYPGFDVCLGWSLRNVMPRVNPDLEPSTVYYPCAGDDILYVLAATGGTRIFMVDLDSLKLHAQAGNFVENIVEDLEAIGAENIAVQQNIERTVINFRNEVGCLRAKPKPGRIFARGNVHSTRDREIIYYLGRDANEYLPEEVKQGIDVYFIKGAGPLRHTTQERILNRLKPGGFLVAYTEVGLPDRLMNIVLSEHGLKLVDDGNITIIQKDDYQPKYNTNGAKKFLSEVLPDTPSTRTENLTPQRIDEVVDLLLRALTDKEKTITKLKYGLEDGLSFSRAKIGAKFNVSEERVRYLETKVKKKLAGLIL
jgi:hypothetical protein